MVTTLSLFLLATAATAAPVFDVLPPRRRLEGDWRPGTGHLQLDTARQLGVERREKKLEREQQLVVERKEQLEVEMREQQLERERREQLDTVLQLLKNPMVHQITNKHYGV